MADRVAYGSLPFKEQIAFFRAKKNVLTEAWTDLWLAEHDHAFMVAGANRIDLLVDLRAAVDKAIADGTGLEAFRHDFDKIVAKYGWAYNGGRNWRTRVIYETNLRTSYAAGRYAQLQALKKVRPFWRYRHSDAVEHPRPMHLAWNGLVLAADDTWWDTHYPPNGWGCQCTVEALNARDLARLGKSGPDTAPPVDMQQVLVGKNGPHPRQVETPAGVDPGFGYAPGKSAFESGSPARALAKLAQDTLRKAGQLPALAGAEALAQLLANPRIVRTLSDTFNALQLLVLGAGLLTATDAPPDDAAMGALAPDLVRALASAGITPTAAPIIGSPAATGGSPADVPELLANPHAVLLDRRTGRLMYVAAPATGGGVRIAWVIPAGAAQSANVYAGDGIATVLDLQARLDTGELVLLGGAL